MLTLDHMPALEHCDRLSTVRRRSMAALLMASFCRHRARRWLWRDDDVGAGGALETPRSQFAAPRWPATIGEPSRHAPVSTDTSTVAPRGSIRRALGVPWRSRARRLRSFASTTAALLVVGPTTPSARAASDDARPVDVTLHDFGIKAGRATVPAGEVVLHVHNAGPSTHEINVDRTVMRRRAPAEGRRVDGQRGRPHPATHRLDRAARPRRDR